MKTRKLHNWILWVLETQISKEQKPQFGKIKDNYDFKMSHLYDKTTYNREEWEYEGNFLNEKLFFLGKYFPFLNLFSVLCSIDFILRSLGGILSFVKLYGLLKIALWAIDGCSLPLTQCYICVSRQKIKKITSYLNNPRSNRSGLFLMFAHHDTIKWIWL